MVQIKITPKAKKDIAGIYDYILQDSYQNAELVAESIIKKIETLKRQADLGKIVKEFSDPIIRELKLFKYRIIYRIEPKRVYVLSIRNFKQLLPIDDLK